MTLDNWSTFFFVSVLALSERDGNTYLYNYLTVNAFLVAKAKLSLTFARLSVFSWMKIGFPFPKWQYHHTSKYTKKRTISRPWKQPLDKVDPPQFPSDEDPQWAQD